MRTEPGRTFIGSVACIDLVGYSRRTVGQQIQLKEIFNGLLSQVIRAVPAEDRIILDTGDGAAITFLADPETCLTACIALRDVLNSAGPDLGAAPGGGPARIGVNLGPLRLAVDVNGRPNIVGDGITTAERIMPFAQPGQILVSRSFHEMVSHISDDLASLFEPGGMHTDKAGQSRELFAVRPVGAARPERPRAGDPDPREMTQLTPSTRRVAPPATTVAPVASAAMEPPPAAGAQPTEAPWIAFLRDVRRVSAAAAVLVALIAAEAWWLAVRGPAPSTRSPQTIASTSAPVASAPSQPAPAQPATTAQSLPPPPAPSPVPAAAKPNVAAAPMIEPAPRAVEAKPPPAPAKDMTPKEPPPKLDVAKKAAAAPPKKEAAPLKAESVAASAPPPAEPPREEPPKVALAAPPTNVATPINAPPVAFPLAVAAKGITTGHLRARLTISAAGVVSSVQVLESEPPRVFDRDAVRTLETWRFNPGADNRSYDVEIAFRR